MLATASFLWQSVFAALVVGIGGTYICWRAWQLYLVKPDSFVPYLFLSLEAFMYLTSLLWYIDILWTEDKRRTKRTLPIIAHNQWPTIDIFITCCKEPTELVLDTVRAALWQDYPTDLMTVYICDDGGDDFLRDWADTEAAMNGTNVRYIRRVKPKDRPHHAKAGNVNHAMSLSSSEFVAILDADMIVNPAFLRTMLPHFASDTAFVQCPQTFYNVPDGDPLGHMASFFFDVMLPHIDTRDSAPCVGTGVIFRRKALESIGGVSTGTLTEDFDTTICLQKQGWKTVYINQKLQHGLAPDDLQATVRQRERWAIGTLQIMSKRNLLFGKGLSWHQRVMYISSGLSYILPVPVLIFSLIPVLALYFDWPIMPVSAGSISTLILLLVPYLIISRLLMYVMYWNIPKSMTARNRDFQMFLWMAPFLIGALLKFIFGGLRKRKFKVTNAKSTKVSIFDGRLKQVLQCWYHALYFALSVAGLIIKGAELRVGKRSCVPTFTYVSQVFYVIMNLQMMMAPLLHVIRNRKPIDRKERITYNEFNVPRVDHESVFPKNTWSVWFLELVPALWGLFYAVIFIGFTFGFSFGCPDYFFPTPVLISEKDWASKTAYRAGSPLEL